jgi:hypothetical protein
METIDFGMLFFVVAPVLVLAVFAALFIGSYNQSQRDFAS